MTLRPEGTAGIVRAYLQRGMASRPQPVKLFTELTTFRYDKPQKGRFRQHHQLGIEAVGSEDPALDAEVVEIGHNLLREAYVGPVTLLLNSMGHRGPNCRDRYLPALRAFPGNQWLDIAMIRMNHKGTKMDAEIGNGQPESRADA